MTEPEWLAGADPEPLFRHLPVAYPPINGLKERLLRRLL